MARMYGILAVAGWIAAYCTFLLLIVVPARGGDDCGDDCGDETNNNGNDRPAIKTLTDD